MQNQSHSGSLRSLEQFAEHSSQIIFSFDVDDNRFVYLNPAFELVWQKSRKSAEANPFSLLETIHSSDKDYLIKEFQNILNGEIKKDVEFRVILPDKRVRWLCANVFLDGQAPEKTTITGCIEDITAQKEKDEYTKKFTAKKNSVLEILAHDLAGPLNNISIASSFIAESSKAYNNPQLDEMIEVIKKTSERSIRLIREFVSQEFLESTTVDVIKKRVNIVENIKEVIDQYKASEDYVGKNFSLHSSAENIYIQIDDLKFRQVINNLISNALKFTPDGGTITVSIEDRQETILFKVIDNGIGIPAKYHDTLFEKFTKARRKGLKGEPSTGLGMSIIKTIIEWHAGKIWFDSQENEGTTFYIELPKE